MAKILTFLEQELNHHIGVKLGVEKKVWLGQLVDEDGKIQAPADSIVISMINLEEEKTMKSQKKSLVEESDGQLVYANPDIKLNLFILCAARFTHHGEALKFLTHVIGFFQARNHFDPSNSPALPEGISKVIVELFSIPLEQLNYLWTTIGSKYLPSVLFKVRLLSVRDLILADEVPMIDGVNQTYTRQ